MLFSTPTFVFAFLPCVLFGYYVILRNKRSLQNGFLTLCSLFFYAWGEPWFVLVMMGSIVANWAFALWLERSGQKQKLVVICALIVNLGIIFIFKYLVFVLTTVNGIVGGGITIPVINLPIGISFFTFQALSYVLDVQRGKGKVQKNLVNVALYISFFPQLIAGPIVRYETIAEQINERKENFDDFSSGVCRFIIGLSKKIILANSLALTADAAFAATQRSFLFSWLGVFAYTFQIFFDFSGYSDMAIGLGKMFGFHFLENFDYPYISKSITDFWRRWHMSLGTWFRDYVYYPLGGSRVNTKKRLVFNLFVVWFLTGLWHGANWTFIAWGLMYFLLITMEKLCGFRELIQRGKPGAAFPRIYTMLFVMIGWVLFRADSLSEAGKYIGNLFGIGVTGFYGEVFAFWFRENVYILAIAALASTPLMVWIRGRLENNKIAQIIYPFLMGILMIITLSYVIKATYNPFIYFNF